MEHDKIQQFYDEVLKSEIAKGSLNDAFGKIQSEEDLRKFIQDSMIPLARAHGYDFTEEDVMAHEKRNMAKRELTDDELDEVVGGAMPRSLILSLPLMMLLGSVSIGGESARAIGTSGTAISWNNEGSIVETVSQKDESMDIDEFVKRMEKEKSDSVASSEQDVTAEEQTAKNTEVSEAENHVADTQFLGSVVNTVVRKAKALYNEKGERLYSNVINMARANNPGLGKELVTNIAMLGAHDTCTAGISSASKLSKSVNSGTIKFSKKIASETTAKMAKAQDAGVYELLGKGARMLDVRVTHEDGVWSTLHSLISGRLDETLKDTIKFLIDNPGEFVVFYIGSFASDVNGESMIDLAKYISTVTVERDGKSYNLYSFVHSDAPLSELTLDKATNNGNDAGVCITTCMDDDRNLEIKSDETCPNGMKYKDIFYQDEVKGYWFNSPSTEHILKNALKVSEDTKSNHPNSFRRMQWQLSPSSNGNTILEKLKSVVTTAGKVLNTGSLLGFAEEHNYQVINNENFKKVLNNCPAAWFDYITTTYGGFNARVNEMILNYNSSLNNGKYVEGSNYQKISKTSELKDSMKIIFRSGQKNSQCGQEYIIVKTNEGFKIMNQKGEYMKRIGKISARLSTTLNINDATTFKFSEASNGNMKITGDNYGICVANGQFRLDRNASRAEEFNVYACEVA